MSQFDIKMIQEKILDFAKQRDWEQFHTPKNISCALSVEASELLEIFQWKKEDASLKDLTLKEQEMIKEEIADVAVYLLRLCQLLNVDLQDAILKKMIKNSEKYPIEKSKGSSKKYTEI